MSGWCCDSRCAVIGCLVTENNLNRSTKCVTWGPGLSSFTFKNRKPIWASVYASGLPAMGPPSFSGLKGPKEALVPLLSPQWGWGWGSISLIAGGSVMCKDQGSHKQEWSSDVTDSLSLSILSYWKTKHSPGLKFRWTVLASRRRRCVKTLRRHCHLQKRLIPYPLPTPDHC